MNLLKQCGIILGKLDDEDIEILFEQAILAIQNVDNFEEAKVAVKIVSPFFIASVYERLNNQRKEFLKEEIRKLELKYGDLSNKI